MNESEAFEQLEPLVRARDFKALAARASELPDEVIPAVAARLDPLFGLWIGQEPDRVEYMEHYPWQDRLFEGVDEPRLLLTRSLTREIDPLDAAQIDHLMRCPHLTRVEILHFGSVELDGCDEALFGGLHQTFPALRRLRVFESGVTDAAIRALVATPIVGQLVALNLSHNRLGPDAVDALAGAGFENLRWLGLSSMHLGRDAMPKLARAPWVSGLRALELDPPDDFDEPGEDYYEGAGEDAPDIEGFRRW